LHQLLLDDHVSRCNPNALEYRRYQTLRNQRWVDGSRVVVLKTCDKTLNLSIILYVFTNICALLSYASTHLGLLGSPNHYDSMN